MATRNVYVATVGGRKTYFPRQARGPVTQAELAILDPAEQAAVRNARNPRGALFYALQRKEAKDRHEKQMTQWAGEWAVETLLTECWLYEVEVPANVRTHPRRSHFLVRLTDAERREYKAHGVIPDGKLVIPPP